MTVECVQLAVPIPSLRESLRVLDRFQLGNLVGVGLGAASVRSTPRAFYACELALVAYSVGACCELYHRRVTGPWEERAERMIGWGRFLQGGDVRQGSRGLQNGFRSVQIKYTCPSWLGSEALHVRHRACLLNGSTAEHYAALGWREQMSITEDLTPSLELPPHDLAARPVRYGQIDTTTDW